jgi:hypothetical protein
MKRLGKDGADHRRRARHRQGLREAYVREGARVAIADIDSKRARKPPPRNRRGAIAVEMDVTDLSIDRRRRRPSRLSAASTS